MKNFLRPFGNKRLSRAALMLRRILLLCCLLWSAVANYSLFTFHFSLNIHAQTITFTGDILLDRGVRHRIKSNGIDSLFTPEIDSIFAYSDIVVGNLECPATSIRTPAIKMYVFRGEPEWLDALRRHGITHLNLANNHSVDQRRGGLEDTADNCQQAGIVPVGAGPNMDEASQPVLLTPSTLNSQPSTLNPQRSTLNTQHSTLNAQLSTFNAQRSTLNTQHSPNIYLFPTLQLSLENFPYLPDEYSVSQESIDSLCLRISRLRTTDPTAYIIVSPHWGIEHRLEPTPWQRRQARAIIDAGADCIIGHHTHTLQTIENYKGKPIYYSIGNFIFDQTKPINTRACMVQIRIAPTSVEVETIPIEIKRCTPHIVP